MSEVEMFSNFVSQKRTFHYGYGIKLVKDWILRDLKLGKTYEEIENKIILRHSQTAKKLLDYYEYIKKYKNIV